MWTFEPGLDCGWIEGHTPYYNLKELCEWADGSGRKPITSIKNFLTHPEIVPLIKANDWTEVFSLWEKNYEYLKETLWCSGVLADFLYYSGVNFWDYLPKDTALKPYELSKGLKWRD